MMAAEKCVSTLIDRLPAIRGRYSENAPLGQLTWFRVGGPAEVMFRPADADDLADFLANKPADVPVTVLGVGSNLLVRDGGVPGVVVRLGRPFARIEAEDDQVSAGAAALDLNVALTARDAGIANLEFLCGVPGTIGGALKMNAGAYGSEMKEVVVTARALDETGGVHDLTPDDLGFRYRGCSVPASWLFVAVRLQGQSEDPVSIGRRMKEIRDAREATQPIRTRTGGSTFANPVGRKAWELIDEAGCRGLERGGAKVSEKHCNFLINTGSATATELEALGEDVRRRVFETSGVKLEWEIRRIGVQASTAGTWEGTQ